jgi:hypothetical protein
VCIALSIAVHSSTDLPVARMFHVPEALNPPDAPEPVRLE